MAARSYLSKPGPFALGESPAGEKAFNCLSSSLTFILEGDQRRGCYNTAHGQRGQSAALNLVHLKQEPPSVQRPWLLKKVKHATSRERAPVFCASFSLGGEERAIRSRRQTLSFHHSVTDLGSRPRRTRLLILKDYSSRRLQRRATETRATTRGGVYLVEFSCHVPLSSSCRR